MSWWMVQEFWWMTIGSALLIAEVFIPKKNGVRGLGHFSLSLLGVALVAVIFQPQGEALGGGYVSSGLTTIFKSLFIVSAVVSVWLALREQQASGGEECVREAVVLPWFILAGMGLMASARDFLMLFVAVELVTVTFYILVSLRRKEPTSLEAGIKYLVMGALSTGFLVYGIALVYGATGSLSFDGIGKTLTESAGLTSENPAMFLGVLLLLAALGFKVAAVPFHWWAPDVYQGAPLSVTTFLSVGSKAAAFSVLITLLQADGPLHSLVEQHGGLLALLASASILFGSLAGLAQRDLKRLVAYSGINNAGFILLALCAGSSQGFTAAVYYIFAYSFGALLLLIVAGHVAIKTEKNFMTFSEISGLATKNATLGWCVVISVASLAGIPPLAGFWGKWFVMSAALHAVYFWAVVIAVIGAASALVYYFGIIRVVFFEEISTSLKASSSLGMTLPYRFGVSAVMAATIVIGLAPNVLLDLLVVVFAEK